jgi:hypothetical protein
VSAPPTPHKRLTTTITVASPEPSPPTSSPPSIGIRKKRSIHTAVPDEPSTPAPTLSRRKKKNAARRERYKAGIEHWQITGIPNDLVNHHLAKRARQLDNRCIREFRKGTDKAKLATVIAAKAEPFLKKSAKSHEESIQIRENISARVESREHLRKAHINASLAVRCRKTLRQLNNPSDNKNIPVNGYKHKLLYK